MLLVLALLAAVIIVLALRHKELAATAEVATLLPADTTLFIHIPDVEANRDAWQRTDLYQLYHEPAVQDFLRKPRAQLPKTGALTDAWQDAAVLRMRDAFLATSTVDTLRLTGGFEFRCGEKEAREVIERWKKRWVAQGAQRSSSAYGKYQIDVLTAPRLSLASVIIDHRFFAATTVEDLKVMLERVERRAKSDRLSGEENFRAAMKQMPREYAGLVYFQPKKFVQKLADLRAQSGRQLPAGQQTLLERIQSVTHAMVFDGGKLRDVDFIAMPRLVDAKLTRETLAAAQPETLIYLAAIINLREQLADAARAPDSALARAGVSPGDCEAAFGDEMSLLADWPATARMPGAVATLSVRDAARARKIATSLAAEAGWEAANRDSSQLFTAPPSGLALMRMVAGLSDKRLAISTDIERVERALAPAKAAGGLESAAAFREASRLVPDGDQFFAWLDLGALYTRLDATLRPILQISAALMPETSDRIDVSKLPPAEVVTKHLGSVVASQSYVNGGYRGESAGTITLGHAVVLGLAGYAGSTFYGKHADVSSWWRVAPSRSKPTPSATPASVP